MPVAAGRPAEHDPARILRNNGSRSALEDLAGLLTSGCKLERILAQVAELAVRAIPGAQAAGLILDEVDHVQTVVATNCLAQEVLDVENGLGEGPCLSAVADRRTFMTGNLGGEVLWPRFGPRAGRLGVHSALSVPLLVKDAAIGALTVYGRPRDSFASESVRLGQAFAAPAAVSVANAQTLAQAERLVAQLSEALDSRAEIDQAMGIVMSRTGGTSVEAFSRLQTQSQDRQVKLVAVAREVLADAVARAKARHVG